MHYAQDNCKKCNAFGAFHSFVKSFYLLRCFSSMAIFLFYFRCFSMSPNITWNGKEKLQPTCKHA